MPDDEVKDCYQRAPKPAINIEHTLAIIKPDAMKKADEIVDIILKSGFTIINKRYVILSPELVGEIYQQHMTKLFFPNLVTYMSSGPMLVMQLARERAVSYFNELTGPPNPARAHITHPNSLRALYGTDLRQNGIHCSSSCEEAEQEIRFFFHDTVLEPILEADKAEDYLAIHVNPTLLQGLSALCKHKPAEPVKWLADWLIENNPNKAKLHDWLGYSIIPPP